MERWNIKTLFISGSFDPLVNLRKKLQINQAGDYNSPGQKVKDEETLNHGLLYFWLYILLNYLTFSWEKD